MRKDDTLIFSVPPVVRAWSSAGGKKESEGPLAVSFDLLFSDASFGCGKWETADSMLQLKCIACCL